MVAVHNIILAIGVTKAASLPKPEQRLITATDVFDVIAEQCHHGKSASIRFSIMDLNPNFVTI